MKEKTYALSMQQRNEVYKEALSIFRNSHDNHGLCTVILPILRRNYLITWVNFYEVLPRFLPEFYEFAMHNNRQDYWWNEDDRTSRIECLEVCILKTSITSKQRHEIYKNVLESYLIHVQKRDTIGLCYLFSLHFKVHNSIKTQFYLGLKYLLPEFYSFKTSDDPLAYWWNIDDYESRIICLQKCIARTQ